MRFKRVQLETLKWNKVTLFMDIRRIALSVNCGEVQEHENFQVPYWARLNEMYLLWNNNEKSTFKGEISSIQFLPNQPEKTCSLDNCLIPQNNALLKGDDALSLGEPNIRDSRFFSKASVVRTTVNPSSQSAYISVPGTTSHSERETKPALTMDQLLTDVHRRYLRLQRYDCGSAKSPIIISRNLNILPHYREQIDLNSEMIPSEEGLIIDFYVLTTQTEGDETDPKTVMSLTSTNQAGVALRIEIERKTEIVLSIYQNSHLISLRFNKIKLKPKKWNRVELQISITSIMVSVNCNSTQWFSNEAIYNWHQFSKAWLLINENGAVFKGSISMLSVIPLRSYNNLLQRKLCTMNPCFEPSRYKTTTDINIGSGLLSNHSLATHSPPLQSSYLPCTDNSVLIVSIAPNNYINNEQPIEINIEFQPIEIKREFKRGLLLSTYLLIEDYNINKRSIFTLIDSKGEDYLIVDIEDRSTTSIWIKQRAGVSELRFTNQSFGIGRWNKLDVMVTLDSVGVRVNCGELITQFGVGIRASNTLNKLLLLTNPIDLKTSEQIKLAYIRMEPLLGELSLCSLDQCLLGSSATRDTWTGYNNSVTRSTLTATGRKEKLKEAKECQLDFCGASVSGEQRKTLGDIASIISEIPYSQYYQLTFNRCNGVNIPIFKRTLLDIPASQFVPAVIIKDMKMFSVEGFLLQFYLWPAPSMAGVNGESIFFLRSSNEDSAIRIRLLKNRLVRIEILEYGHSITIIHRRVKLLKNRWNKVSVQITIVDISVQINCGKIQSIFNDGFSNWRSLTLLNVLNHELVVAPSDTRVTRLQILPLSSTQDIRKMSCMIDICLINAAKSDIISKGFLDQFKVSYMKCGDRFFEVISQNIGTIIDKYRPSDIDLVDVQYSEGLLLSFYYRPVSGSKGTILSMTDSETIIEVRWVNYLTISIRSNHEHMSISLDEDRIKLHKWNKVTMAINVFKISVSVNCGQEREYDNFYVSNWQTLKYLHLFGSAQERELLDGSIANLQLTPLRSNQMECQLNTCITDENYSMISLHEEYEGSDELRRPGTTVQISKPTTTLFHRQSTAASATKRTGSRFTTSESGRKVRVKPDILTVAELISDAQRGYIHTELYRCNTDYVVILSRDRNSLPDNNAYIGLNQMDMFGTEGFLMAFYLITPDKRSFSETPETVFALSSNLKEELYLKVNIARGNRIELQMTQKGHVTLLEFNEGFLQENVWNKVEIQISITTITLTVDCNATQSFTNAAIHNWKSFSKLWLLNDEISNIFEGSLAMLSIRPMTMDNSNLLKHTCTVNSCFNQYHNRPMMKLNIESGILSNHSLSVHRPVLETTFLHCKTKTIVINSIYATKYVDILHPVEISTDFGSSFMISLYLVISGAKDDDKIYDSLITIYSGDGVDSLRMELKDRSFISIFIGNQKYEFISQLVEKDIWNKIDVTITTDEVSVGVNCGRVSTKSRNGARFMNSPKKLLLLTNQMSLETSTKISIAKVTMVPWNSILYSCSFDDCLQLPHYSTPSSKQTTTIAGRKTSEPGSDTGVLDPGTKGPRGKQGASGMKGIQGDVGPPGVKGDKGDMGIRGPSGKPGPEGISRKGQPGVIGSQGIPGVKGEKGINGAKGSDGVTGHPGRRGIEGIKGSAGMPGDKGLKGAPGYRGMRGNEGRPGEHGKPGLLGMRGGKGAKGTKGDIGAIGSKGDNGKNGKSGSRGFKGVKGIIGPPGKPGLLQGPMGPSGAIGMPGDEGPRGAKGKMGQTGNPGEKGNNGIMGKIGLPGAKGDNGPIGANGNKGLQGNNGGIGTKGIAGAIGNEGVNGDKGDPGFPGPLGLPGDQGNPGPPGLPGDRGPPGKEGEKGQKGLSPRGIKGLPGSIGSIGERGEKGNRAKKGEKGSKGSHGLPGEKGQRGTVGNTINGKSGQIGLKGETGPYGIPGTKGSSGADGSMGLEGVIGTPGQKGVKGDIGDGGDIGYPGPLGEPGTYILVGLTPTVLQNISHSLVKLHNDSSNSMNFTEIKMDSSKRIKRLYEEVFSFRNERGLSQEWPITSCKDYLLQNIGSSADSIWLDPNEGNPDDAVRADCKKKRPTLNKVETESSFTCISSSFESGDLLTYLKPYDSDITWQSEMRLDGLVLSPPDYRNGYPHVSQLNFIQMRSKYAEQEIEFLCDESIVYADISNSSEDYQYATAFLTLDDNYVDLTHGLSIGSGYGFMDKRIFTFDNGRTIFNVTILYDECKYKTPGSFTKMMLSTNKPEMLPIVDFKIKYFKSNDKCVLGANIYPVCFE